MIISKTPNLMSFAGNPMRYLLSSEPGGGSIRSVVKFRFTGIDTTVGHSFTISQNGSQRTFTLKNNPSASGDFPVAFTGQPIDYWCFYCYSFIRDDLQLSTDFDITLDNTDIVFTAKIPSAIYDIVQVSSNVTGMVAFTETGGQAPSTDIVEGVLMRLYKDETNLIGEEYKPLDSLGNVRFDVQEYLYANLLLSPPPRFNNALPGLQVSYQDYICKYRTTFINRVNGVFEQRSKGDSLRYAIAGGLNREDLVALKEENIDFFSLTSTQEQFLTWWDGVKTTDKAAKESLFFAFQSPASYTKYRLKITIWDPLGANETTWYLTDLATVSPWTVIELTVGYAELNLSSYLGGNVGKWKVFLEDENGVAISDEFTFQLDTRYHENTRYFRFRNSWGVYDSIRCTGNFELSLEHERENVTYINDEDETSFNAPVRTNFSKESQLFKANSGFLSKGARQYLRDFERSFDIYEYADGRLYPINITSKKSNLIKDGDYNYYMAFEYQRAYQDFFFSRMLRTVIKKAFSAEYSDEYS